MTRGRESEHQNVEDILMLTPLQEGILYHVLNHAVSELYFEQLCIQIESQLMLPIFKQAWTYVITNNEMLRTVFRWKQIERPIQIILKEQSIPFTHHDFSDLPQDEQHEKLTELCSLDRQLPFDLETGPLIRLTVCRFSTDSFAVILSYHHIILDGWSTGVILQELQWAYSELSQGRQPQKQNKLKFKEYLRWLKNQDIAEGKTFWQEYLSGFTTKTLLPTTSLPRQDTITANINSPGTVEFDLPQETYTQLNNLAKHLGITLPTILHAVWGILLQRFNNYEDIIFGTTLAGRPAEIVNVEKIVGLFITTVPLRVRANTQMTIHNLLNSLQHDLLMRQGYEHTPLVDIQAQSEIAGQELFDSLFVVENYPLEQFINSNKSSTALNVSDYTVFERTNYPLTVIVTLWDELRFKINYDTTLFSEITILRWGEYLTRLLSDITNKLNSPISAIDFLSQEERKELLEQFNNTQNDFQLNQTICDIFATQVRKIPDALAIVSTDITLTYQELATKASTLAKKLEKLGVTADKIVAIMLEPSPATLVGILGILQAGGAYLPIDPHYPHERIQYMLTDSGSTILITEDKWTQNLNLPDNVEVLNINEKLSTESEFAEINTHPDNLAYVIYTSGSTGRPKGVMLEHQGLLNLLMSLQSTYPTLAGDTWLFKTPFTFDVSLTELFAWILGGGRVAILPPGDEKDPQKIAEAIDKYQVTHLNFVPSMYTAFMDYLELKRNLSLYRLKYLMVAGEAIAPKQVKRFYELTKSLGEEVSAHRVHLINLYGPTEATIYATHFALEDVGTYQNVPIGHSLPNTRIYILNQNAQLQPIGFAGELCIAGIGLARGYLNLPEMTREKFVADPFVIGEVMYRTGDLARWLSDGNIEYLGRIDQQVKIRGYRIEIGEIENQLLCHPAVKEAVVVDLMDLNDLKYLCAYLVPPKEQKQTETSILELREFLAKTLPEYMIPTHFIWLERLPLTANGKINRKALPQPYEQVCQIEYLPPKSKIEEQLALIWQEVLGVARVGRQDHFFNNLGGHSLKAVQVVAKIFKKMAIEISVRDLFQNPTIEQLALTLNKQKHLEYNPIPLQPIQHFYPVSSAQKRIYLLQQLEPEKTVYNLPLVLELRGRVDKERLEKTFQQLVDRHDVLRTAFQLSEGEPVQEIQTNTEFTLTYLDWSNTETQKYWSNHREVDRQATDIVQMLAKQFLIPFHLDKAPLFRAYLVKQEEGRHFLWLDLHHIIADGVSLDILIEEFSKLYHGESLHPLKTHYHDYAIWYNNLVAEEKMTTHEQFWLEEFAGEIPILNFPTDYTRPIMQNYTGSTVKIWSNEELLKSLRQMADANDCTLYMILFALYNVLLARYSGQEDLVVGTPVAGREHPDVQHILGMFVNTLAIRTQPLAKKSFHQYLCEVKAKILLALEHQNYPLETLLERLNLPHNSSRNPLFDTVFLVQNLEGQSKHIELSGVQVQYHEVETNSAKFDLTLLAEEVENKLCLKFEYATKLYKPTTIAQLGNHLLRLAELILLNPEKPIGELELLSAEEKDQLLFVFNDTRTDYPREKTVHQLFIEQVQRTPDRIALRFGEQIWTYAQVNLLANRVAQLLRTKGVGADTVVGLMTKHSAEMIIGIIGILQADGAYLPIDSGLPDNRKCFLLKDADVHILLTQSDFGETEVVRNDQWEVIYLEQIISSNEAHLHEVTDTTSKISSENLAYIMYTSGSTGQPKGVMIPHRGIVRLLYNTNYLHLDQHERIMQIAPYSFDASTFEIWAALLFGGELILLSEESILNIQGLSKTISNERVSTCWLTSSLFNRIIDEAPEGLKGLKQLLVGGEVLSLPHIKKARKLLSNTRLINGYGPTENTTFTCCYEIKEISPECKSIPIGKPISNTQVYILDDQLNLVPIGAIGELYLAGDGLARGYLKREELNQERFISHPKLQGETLYKSGDLGRYLPDGNIEFLGRRDDQVKIRGFRIEIGEIEAALYHHPKIQEAVISIKVDNENNKFIVAYIIAEEDLSILELRNDLRKVLPEYMLPNQFITLKELPLLPSGKVNRKALPEPTLSNIAQTDYVAPRNPLEEKLTQIFAQVLNVKRVGINDHFFMLGGHSLKATQVIAKIAVELKLELPLRELFKHPVVKDLALVLADLNPQYSTEIPLQPAEEYYPLSSAQKRIFILQQMGEAEAVYNIPIALIIEGHLNVERFKEALHHLTKRHAILRTQFLLINGEPIQHVCQEVEVDFEVEEIEDESSQITEFIHRFIRPFNLNKAPLMRVQLLKLSDKRQLLMLDIHHIIADGHSMEILLNELKHLYNHETLQSLRIQYHDFAIWQNERLSGEIIQNQKNYWLTQLSGELPVLSLPTDYPRPAIQSYAGSSFRFAIDNDLSSQLKKLAENNTVTLYMLLLSAYNLLLARLSGQNEVVVGSPCIGRTLPELQNLIGMFVNTLTLRSKPLGDKIFSTYLAEIKELVLTAFENQEYPFEMLVDQLHLERDLSRHPLFDTMFDLQSVENGSSEFKFGDVTLKPYPLDQQIAKFDLNLTAEERKDGIEFSFIYNTQLFKGETIQHFAGYYQNILQGIVTNPHMQLGLIPLLSDKEKEHILYNYNNTNYPYPVNRTIYQLFEEFTEIQPEAIALIVDERQLTYKDLNQKANQLAHYLLQNGIKPDTLVGIMLERSPEMLIAILAVWKAGGAYVPIDPLYPEERITYMLTDSQIRILLTQKTLINKIETTYQGMVIAIDTIHEHLQTKETVNPKATVTLNNLAYVIYTSGSTGKPKGVMIEHGNILNSHYSWQKQFDLLNSHPILLQVASFAFDVFVADLCRSLGSGGTLVIATEERNSLTGLINLMLKHQVTMLNSTPGLLLPLLNYLTEEKLSVPTLRYLLIGADSWSLRDYKHLLKQFASQFKIINCYGVTEAAVDATWYGETKNLPEQDSLVPIGKPIYNVQVYILDNYLNPVPIGVIGEIYIGGAGVARGYWNRPELTAERFIPNPLETDYELCNKTKLYRTGDLGRYLPDGNIEFIGRCDHQVKIRGFRLELSEIESAILKHPEIKEVVVIARERQDGNKYLAAYFVSTISLETEQLRKLLTNIIPEYMIPEYLIQLERLPLTPNGKVDMHALPEIQMTKSKLAPRNELEERLLHLWESVLEIKGIGIEDNFFLLGGHSLKGMILLAKILKEFHVELPLRQLFAHPILKDLAELLREAKTSQYLTIPIQAEREYYPLSSAQKRLFVLAQFEPNEINYNMPMVIAVEGKLDILRFEYALHLLIQRHTSLRTAFRMLDGEPVQQILPEVELNFNVQTLDELLTPELLKTDFDQAIQQIIRDLIKPFDLQQAPLMRVELLQQTAEKFLLFFDMHHIISDGVSMNLLVKDLVALYAKEELPEITLQYTDFAVWQNEIYDNERLADDEKYWLSKFSSEVPVLNLSTDYPRPQVQSMEGSNFHFTLPESLLKQVQALVAENNSTMYMILLAAYTILMNKYTGQEDILIGSPIAGRLHPELQSIVGMFVNTLVLRNYPAKEKSINQFIQEVTEATLAAFEHQNYQFEMLIDRLHLERNANRNPLFDIAFVMQNMENIGHNLQLPEVRFKDYPFDYPVAKFDLTLVVEEKNDDLHCTFNYCTKLFKRETIERMATHWTNILYAMVTESQKHLGVISILTESERQRVLYDWNQTQATYPNQQTIHQLFEEQVALSPERIAVVCREERITYGELNYRANQISRVLRDKGITPDTLVGILVERSLDMLIGIYAILKAGGAYVPLDPDYPTERIAYMLQDSQVPVLLSQSHLQSLIQPDFTGTVLYLDKNHWFNEQNGENLVNLTKPDHLAYIIYTSGSTGRPKGVMIEHRNVTRLLKVKPNNYDFHAEDVWTLFHSYCFDFSVWEIFGSTLYGAKLVIVDQEARIDPVQFLMLCKREKVTVLNQTPAAFYNFIHAELEAKEHTLHQHLRYVIFGGEALNFSKLIPWVKLYPLSQIALINMYGITETTVHVTYERIRETDLYTGYRSLVGKPIYTTTLYLLDQVGLPVPPGVPGEIYVGGLGVGRGYLNQPELTKERFMINPFVSGERLYRSGDLGKFLADGNLEYLGRIDQQVKIRGFRIELGEIEETLLKHPAIQDAVVIERTDHHGSKYLAGYIVPKLIDQLPAITEVSELKTYMQKTLPDYMIPTALTILHSLPLTSNGKVNRQALPEPVLGKGTQADYQPPRDEVESQLVAIWSKILGIERVGVNENFFDLGGNSLLLIKVYSEIKEAFPTVDFRVTDLFKYSTISALAELFRTKEKETTTTVEEDNDIEEFIM